MRFTTGLISRGGFNYAVWTATRRGVEEDEETPSGINTYDLALTYLHRDGHSESYAGVIMHRYEDGLLMLNIKVLTWAREVTGEDLEA